MTKTKLMGVGVAALLLAGCNLTQGQQTGLAAAGGGAAGLIAADLLDANDNWTILAGLGGAAAGAAIQRNSQTGQCAYPQGNGLYSVGPCP